RRCGHALPRGRGRSGVLAAVGTLADALCPTPTKSFPGKPLLGWSLGGEYGEVKVVGWSNDCHASHGSRMINRVIFPK
ncbi:hypothetical protein HAX54_049101, partial [Datura stramonium]|nr:hypothetical protein [Datura stramonium]